MLGISAEESNEDPLALALGGSLASGLCWYCEVAAEPCTSTEALLEAVLNCPAE